MSRPAVGVALVLALAACAPDAGAGTQRVQVEGQVTQVAAAAGGRMYILEVAEQGLLPLAITEGRPPMSASGVVVEVPDSLEIPADAGERFEVLDEYVRDTGESLAVVDFLP